MTQNSSNTSGPSKQQPQVKIAGNSKAITAALVKAAEYAKRQAMAKCEAPSESPL
jgi:hypothetical protein